MIEAISFKSIFRLLKETGAEWVEDKAPRLGAALSYYTVFSIAPLILIAITITGLIFADAQQQVIAQVQSVMGEKGAEAIKSMIQAGQKPAQSSIATILGFATLIFGAAGVFIQLKDALNTIWDVDETSAKGGIWAFVKKYFLSFSMVLGIGFLLLVSLLLEAAVAIAGEFAKNYIPGMDVVMQVVAVVISFAVVALLFAMLFKFLPDVKVAWRDVWIGAILTAALFVIGKIILGLYLGKAAAASAYGAAGSLVIVLLWVYYSSQILFFGAEFTQVYARHHGSHFTPEVLKEKLTPKQKLVAESEEQRKQIVSTFGKFNLRTMRGRELAARKSKRHQLF
ncbi:MAG: YihY/virulence factor BrkB family protein [Verrucomicrobiota bacterium]